MARNGKPTRDRILAQSKELVLKNGFSGTSIDQILEKTGITKGAFFYHFKSKNTLAQALMEEYAKDDMSHLKSALNETEHLRHDPVKRLLAFIQVFIDMMENLKEPPSCLYASYIYESSQFEEDVLGMISDTILKWREAFIELLNEVLANRRSTQEIDATSLADQFTVIFEGGNVISKILDSPDITSRQLRHLKMYMSLLFEERG